MRILVVEDDTALRRSLAEGLANAGYQVDAAADGEEALLFAADRAYAAIILDRRLPGLSGDEVLAQLRRRSMTTPVLILTALDRISDRVAGLDAGADDYLVKPFAFEELVARLRALTRRVVGGAGYVDYGDLRLDEHTGGVRCGQQTVLLTRREFELLQALMAAGGRPVPPSALVDAAWAQPWDASDEALWSHMKNLRKKLAMAGSRVRIQTRRGIGYHLTVGDPPEGAATSTPATGEPA